MRETFRVTIACLSGCILTMGHQLPLPVLAVNHPPSTILSASSQRNCAPGAIRCPRRGEDLVANKPEIPYIISPRRTYLLRDTIVIRWNPIPDAKQYVIRIQGEGTNQTFTVGDGQQPAPTQLVNPKVSLKPNVYYLVTVESDTGQFSQEDDRPDLGFWLLDRQQGATIQQRLDQLNQQKQTEIEQRLAQVELYRQYELYAEAIATLEPLVQQHSSPLVYQTLAELYVEVQLPSLAAITYQQAIARTQDPQQQADLLTNLGDLYLALREKENAKQTFQAALSHYQSLGSRDRMTELQRKLQNLNN